MVDVVCGLDVPDLSIFECKEVCYQGQKVAAVAAVDPDIAEDALALIQVDYEELPRGREIPWTPWIPTPRRPSWGRRRRT